jgi:hypothetical protein
VNAWVLRREFFVCEGLRILRMTACESSKLTYTRVC